MSRRFHYAWVVLAASVVLELFGLGFGIFALTTLYPYIITAFPSWSRTLVFAPTSIVIATCALMAPLTGAFIDRFPIRALFLTGIVLQSAALLAFSRVVTPGSYLGASLLLGLGLSGVTILPNQVLLSRWFRGRVGLANGILLAATALGGALSPPLVTRLAEAVGWRDAFGVVAVLAFGPPLLVVVGLIRDRPGAMGLEPYGGPPSPGPAPHAPDLSPSQAIRRGAFWGLAGVIFFAGLPCYSYNKHILVFLREVGLAPRAAADLKGLFFVISAVSRLTFGWLSDRVDRRRLVLGHLLALALGYPLLLAVPTHPWVLAPCIVLVGVGYGGLLPTIPIMTLHYFGRTGLGGLLGLLKLPYDSAAALAPLLTAFLYDRTGSYTVPEAVNAAFAWVGLGIAAVGLPAALPPTPGGRSSRPHPREDDQEADEAADLRREDCDARMHVGARGTRNARGLFAAPPPAY